MKAVQKSVFVAFLIIPFMELYLLIQVGSIIGVFPTLLLVVLTATLGAVLVRQQGFATWQRLQANLAQGVMPAYELIEGLLLLLGGLLLLTPGFFTDALGFACLVPQLRHKFARYMIENHLFSVLSGTPLNTAPVEPNVLEGEFKREE